MSLSRIKQYEFELERMFAVERAESILDKSSPILREKVDKIRHCFEDAWRCSILNRYQVAVIIRDIYDDVNDNNGSVYGAKAVEAIKKLFGWDDGIIYQALNVANAFTPEELDNITEMRLPGGKPLSYSHLVVLARVEDDDRKENLLKQTVKEGWSTRRLADAAEIANGPEPDKPQERRGRPLAKPKDFDAVVDQQAHFAEDFLNRNDHVWSHPEHGLTAKLENLETADFTQERGKRLKGHVKVMSDLATKAKERADEATHAHAIFVQALKEHAARFSKLGAKTLHDNAAA